MNAISRLTNVDPREAWPNEATNFTPWLASHIDQLGEAIGVPLEIEGTEVSVESFSADIIAGDLINGTRVLIENQLEKTDHTHLGQIMTYLAGLEASSVVWIATEFREPHLAAINWLNEHTVDPFAFFAIKLRVVRIADSPLAPIFEIAARPNTWERDVQAATKESSELSEYGKANRVFWQAYLDRYPSDVDVGFKPNGTTNVWLPIGEPPTRLISVFKTKTHIGLFVRGLAGADPHESRATLAPESERLSAIFDAAFGAHDETPMFHKARPLDHADKSSWPSAFDWLHSQVELYVNELKALSIGETA